MERAGGCVVFCFFFQAEDGIRDLVRSRGLGDVYKRQKFMRACGVDTEANHDLHETDVYTSHEALLLGYEAVSYTHLTLPTSDSSVDLGGRRIIKKKNISDYEQR